MGREKYVKRTAAEVMSRHRRRLSGSIEARVSLGRKNREYRKPKE